MVDAHVHFLPRPVLDWLEANPRQVAARREQRDPRRADFLTVEGKWSFELKEAFVDEAVFLTAQQKAGVEHSVVSPLPQLFLYEKPAAVTAEVAVVYNDALAAFVRRHPGRLSGLATVPLNGGEQAAAELARAMGAGLRGAIVGPGWGGRLLSDEGLRAFWEEADRRRAVVFVHPLLNADPRLARPQMPNLIGVPWETTLCATDLILSGLLDRYPAVRILLAHGGGFLPYQVGRLDKGYEQWPPVRAHLQGPPREYLARFWYDTVLWSEQALSFLVALVGEERTVPGSDFPFDLSAWPPAARGDSGFRTLLGS